MNTSAPRPAPTPVYVRELPSLFALCAEASEAVRAEYRPHAEPESWRKADDSPVTRADFAAHDILTAGLERMAPDVPVLSEEGADNVGQERRRWPRLWLVDPLDGTREFINGSGQFTINVALVEGHRPVFGLIYEPLADRGWAGGRCLPPQCWSLRGGGWQCSEHRAPTPRPGPQVRLLASRRHRDRGLEALLDWFRREGIAIDRRNSGSALKFSQLLDGDGDCYPRFAPCSEWDIAAGQALLEAAGGALLDLDGAPVSYNCRASLRAPNFLAVADRGDSLWRGALSVMAGFRGA